MSDEVRIQPPPFLYNVAVEDPDGSHMVDWGNAPGWLEKLSDHLDQAVRLTLIPKPGQEGLPVVTVDLTEEVAGERRRWVLLSRVFNRMTRGGQLVGRPVRCYCIGWQATVEGRNVQALTWVYPNGSIEAADNPSFVDLFLDLATPANEGVD